MKKKFILGMCAPLLFTFLAVIATYIPRTYVLSSEVSTSTPPLLNMMAEAIRALPTPIFNSSVLPRKSFSAIGVVSVIKDAGIIIHSANGSDGSESVELLIDVSHARFETKDYGVLVFSDIIVGDRIIAKGYIQDGNIVAQRIISLVATSSNSFVPIVIATSTPSVVSTSTDEFSTSTPEVSTTTSEIATSTENIPEAPLPVEVLLNVTEEVPVVSPESPPQL